MPEAKSPAIVDFKVQDVSSLKIVKPPAKASIYAKVVDAVKELKKPGPAVVLPMPAKEDARKPDKEHFLLVISRITTALRNKEVKAPTGYNFRYYRTEDGKFAITLQEGKPRGGAAKKLKAKAKATAKA